MTLLAFVGALGLLVVVHELGHYWLARLCGVKVLRFSVGFGKVLWLRRFGRDQTEWAIAAIPLGGFVRMLDEREAPVAEHELARAFNRQPVARRFAIVAAGPLANLLLAVLIYWGLFMHGSEQLRAVVAAPEVNTVAAAAGIKAGDSIVNIDAEPIATWQEMRWVLTRRALDHQPLKLEVENPQHELRTLTLATAGLSEDDLGQDVLNVLGLVPYRPPLPALIGVVTPGSVAAQAGLQAGDRVLAIDAQPVREWSQVVARVRVSAGQRLQLTVLRQGQELSLEVTPAAAQEGQTRVGRLGVQVAQDDSLHERMFVKVSHAPWPALLRALVQTRDTAGFTLEMMGRMFTGAVSWTNISGPVTIADYAGQSAQMGWLPYLNFIALISISLGVLNLLPIPVLDGGHLLYYIAEIVKGGPLSERVMEVGQQIGLALLMMLMAFAFYNDINRLVSG